jgi:hypothetical protein
MSDGAGGSRRFTEEEVGRILKRATEIQVAEPTSAGPGGMTLEELEDIAREAGIDPLHLRRAALEVESDLDEPSIANRLAGQALELRFEATVAGELSPAGLERVVSVIQGAARDHGRSSLVGQTLTWRNEPGSGMRATQVVVTSRDGETRIRVEERLQEVAKQLFGGVVGGVGTGVGVGVGIGVGLGVLGSALFAAAFPVGVLAISYLAAREAYRLRVQERRRTLSALLERLRDEVADSVTGSQLGPGDPPARLPRG